MFQYVTLPRGAFRDPAGILAAAERCDATRVSLPGVVANRAAVTFMTGDYLGRRWSIWIGMGLVIVGATLQASSFSVAQLVVGRIVTGLGTGMKTSTVPM